MKYPLFFTLILIISGCFYKICIAQENKKENQSLPALKFTEKFYDAGEIIQGKKIKHEFTFTNTSNENVIILDASGSCGCTVGKYPKRPIKPNETASIRVTYDSYNQKGYQHKTITITTDSKPEKYYLTLRILVKEKG